MNILEVEKNKTKRKIKENIHIIKNRKKVVKKNTEIRHLQNLFVNLLQGLYIGSKESCCLITNTHTHTRTKSLNAKLNYYHFGLFVDIMVNFTL